MSTVTETMNEVPVDDVTEVLVIGYNPATDQLTLHPSRKRFDFCHQMINRAMVELVLFEKESAAARIEAAKAAVETSPATTSVPGEPTPTNKDKPAPKRRRATKKDAAE